MPSNNEHGDWLSYLESRSPAWKREFADLVVPILFDAADGMRRDLLPAKLPDGCQVSYSGFPLGEEGEQVFRHLLRVATTAPAWEEYGFDMRELSEELGWDVDCQMVMSRLTALLVSSIRLTEPSLGGIQLGLLQSYWWAGEAASFEIQPETVALFGDWASEGVDRG